MIGKRKIGTERIRTALETVSVAAVKNFKDKGRLARATSWFFIALFVFGILFEFYNLFSRQNDIAREQANTAKLQKEITILKNQIVEKNSQRNELISDPIAIETAARKLGMSKEGERSFIFID